MEPQVSIITPTYNHERYLGPCIASVLGQTFTAWEQIIIDDGSTDGTARIAAGSADPRVRYVRQEHVGVEQLPATYNRALALCRAPLVAILEGDDWWPIDKLATLVPAFADPSVVLAYGYTEVVGEHLGELPDRIPPAHFERIFRAGTLENTPVGTAARAMLDARGLTFTYPCSVILRRAALERIGGFQQRPGLVVTDHPTFLRLAFEGRFHFVRRTMGYWRVHDAGVTVRKMEQILRLIALESGAFRAAHGAGAGGSDAEWDETERLWRTMNGWFAMRRARRLLVDGKWDEARAPLHEVMSEGRLRTAWLARVALLCARLHVSAEWAYRLRGRSWYRRNGAGGIDVVEGRA